MSNPQHLVPVEPVLVACNGGHFKSKRRMYPGRYELTAHRIVFYQRSMIWMYFGLIGALIGAQTSGKRAFDLDLGKIVAVARGKYLFNKKILDLTMADGSTHRISVEKFDEFSARLRDEVARRTPVVQSGAEAWRISA